MYIGTPNFLNAHINNPLSVPQQPKSGLGHFGGFYVKVNFFQLCSSWGSVINSKPRPLFLPGRTPSTHCTVGWVGPRAGLDRCGKSLPPPGFDLRTVQPVASHITDCAIPAYHTSGRDTSEWVISSSQMPLPAQHTTKTQDTKKACPQWDSKSWSRKSSGCRPTPLPTRPPGLAHLCIILPRKFVPTCPPINITLHILSICSAHLRFNNHNIRSMKPLIVRVSSASCYLFSLGFSDTLNPPGDGR